MLESCGAMYTYREETINCNRPRNIVVCLERVLRSRSDAQLAPLHLRMAVKPTSMHSLLTFLGALMYSSTISSCCHPFELFETIPPSDRIDTTSKLNLNSFR